MDMAKSLYKPKYTDRATGTIRESRTWYARIGGRRYSLKTTDISVAEKRANIIKRQLDSGDDVYAIQNARQADIGTHLEAYELSQRVKGCCDDYLVMLMNRLRRVFKACQVYRLADVRVPRIEDWLNRMQVEGTFNTQTRKHYCVNLRQFGNFLLSRSLVHKNPFANLQRVYNIDADRRIERRCLTPDELRTFLASVGASDKVRQGLNGKDRRLLYWLASVTGLRRNELGSLTKDSFSLEGTSPTVTVTATRTKNRRVAILPLRAELVAELTTWLAKKKHGKILFPITSARTSDMIRQDLKAAGIAIEKNEKRVDFQALRVTMISHLAINGVPIQLAQKLARHSTPVLTANVYTHLDISDLQQAVEKLPAMTGTPATNGQPKTATGEHGQ